MSIATELENLNGDILDAYTAVSAKGGTIPAHKNMDNLDTAIASIPTGGSFTGIPRDVVSGVYKAPTTSYTFSLPNTAYTVGNFALAYAFYGSTGPTSVSFGNATTFNEGACQYMCYNCTALTGISKIGITRPYGSNSPFQSAFYGCTNLTGAVDISDYLGGWTQGYGAYAFASAFYGTKITSIDISSFDCTGATNYNAYAFNQVCYNCKSLTSVDLRGVKNINNSNMFASAFYGCTALTTVNLSSLKNAFGSSSMNGMFNGCTALTTLDLSSLQMIQSTNSGSSVCANLCASCTSLRTVDLSGLTTISSSYGFQYAFRNCTSLTSMTFTSLATLTGTYTFQYAFQGCTSLTTLSFPALTTSSFGNANSQFNNMLQGLTGVTVHFPAAVQSKIGSWASVTGGFGGTNTTVLFDL